MSAPEIHQQLFRSLPSVDRLLRASDLQALISTYGQKVVKSAAQDILSRLRQDIRSGEGKVTSELTRGDLLPALCQQIEQSVLLDQRQTLVPVINLTGTVIHTNLGRARLPEAAIKAVESVARLACNLEYDLDAGQRGDRDSHVERLITELTGAEAVTVVNNNAAAVLLVLNTLAPGREVIISRGELVEIGGSFRIPDIMRSANSILREVGTTNRTHLSDYAGAVCDATGLLMQVHTSNYEIRGFTSSVSQSDLFQLAKDHGLPLAVDLGSGSLMDLRKLGLPHEMTVRETLAAGADLVTFSGDKLLGGPQAGLIAGRRDLVKRIKANPLKRALRVDKLTLAALGETLALYRDPDRIASHLPILRALTRHADDIAAAGQRLLPQFQNKLADIADVSLAECKSQIGSGSLPLDLLPSTALAIRPRAAKGQTDELLQRLALAFRRLPTPVVGRLNDGCLLFDLRCLDDEDTLLNQLSALTL